MSDLRKDPIVGRWVIIAPERHKRPHDNTTVQYNGNPENCPFCAGNESQTPKEIMAYRKPGSQPNQPGWWLRVIPNKYPALKPEDDYERNTRGMFASITGKGHHEVIIETPEHDHSLSKMSTHEISEILWAYRDRILNLQEHKEIRYIILFKNSGREAGASLEHPHSQLIGLPVVPKRVQEEIDSAFDYFRLHDSCVFCDYIAEERAGKERIIYENETICCLAPYASRFPYEIWVLPKHHQSAFEQITRKELEDLAEAINQLFQKIDTKLQTPAYNLMLHTAPAYQSDLYKPYYHWHIEIIPRLSNAPGGFEWGTGFYINTVSPEKAAQTLREEKLNA